MQRGDRGLDPPPARCPLQDRAREPQAILPLTRLDERIAHQPFHRTWRLFPETRPMRELNGPLRVAAVGRDERADARAALDRHAADIRLELMVGEVLLEHRLDLVPLAQ